MGKLVLWVSYFPSQIWEDLQSNVISKFYCIGLQTPTRWEMNNSIGQRNRFRVGSFLNLWNTLETSLCLGWKWSFNMFAEIAWPSQEESDLFEPQRTLFLRKLLLSTEGWKNQPSGKNHRPYNMYTDCLYVYVYTVDLIQCFAPCWFKLVIHIISICQVLKQKNV